MHEKLQYMYSVADKSGRRWNKSVKSRVFSVPKIALFSGKTVKSFLLQQSAYPAIIILIPVLILDYQSNTFRVSGILINVLHVLY